jgi:hypothetical protein
MGCGTRPGRAAGSHWQRLCRGGSGELDRAGAEITLRPALSSGAYSAVQTRYRRFRSTAAQPANELRRRACE